MQVGRSSLRSRVAPLAFGMVLALIASVASAATAKPSALDDQDDRERIDSLWLDADGTSGTLSTTPIFLDGSPGQYHFGPKLCGKRHRLGPETLHALQSALANAQPIRVDATEQRAGGDDTRQCITGVAFFAPIK